MKVTGYMLREALKRWQLRRETAQSQFKGSLVKFPGEEKLSPGAVAALVLAAESAIGSLQAAQALYNTRVTVLVGETSKPRPLVEAVKAIGGLSRVEKLWTDAATGKDSGVPRYMRVSGVPTERDKDKIVAEPQVTPEQAQKQAEDISRRIGALRIAIATGNAVELDLDLDPALLE